MKEKVLLGFSGGVDSAVSAKLLLEQGYEVSGCFMRNWDALANNDYLGNPTAFDDQCPQEKDYDDAKEAAAKLGIPLLRVDFVKEYWDKVFTYFLDEYKKGRTPNPDVYCNKFIKFDSFLDYAMEKGFDLIAMGHYAKRGEWEGHSCLYKAKDKSKDQTYFLAQLNEEQISKCLFPLGDVLKSEVREMAHALGLDSVMDKKDSTGVCFIGERNFREFLQNYFPAKRGDILELHTHRKLGEHPGTLYYTIGQRHGLGIGGVKGEAQKPWFVAKKDSINNILYVSAGDEEDLLYPDKVVIDTLNFVGPLPEEGAEVGVKFRYRAPDCLCRISYQGDHVVLYPLEKVRAVTTGQFAVIYIGERMLGSGIIAETYLRGERTDI